MSASISFVSVISGECDSWGIVEETFSSACPLSFPVVKDIRKLKGDLDAVETIARDFAKSKSIQFVPYDKHVFTTFQLVNNSYIIVELSGLMISFIGGECPAFMKIAREASRLAEKKEAIFVPPPCPPEENL